MPDIHTSNSHFAWGRVSLEQAPHFKKNIKKTSLKPADEFRIQLKAEKNGFRRFMLRMILWQEHQKANFQSWKNLHFSPRWTL